MPKRYRGQFVDDLNFTLFMHPSTWAYSYLTKSVATCVTITGILVSSIAFFNALFGAPAILTIIMFFSFFWYGYVISVLVRSPRILRRNYNVHLYPIEVAFNNMRSEDQRKYSSLLTDAYAICARRNYDEFDELKKIKELFELTVPDDAKPMTLDKELARKRKELKEKQDFEKMQQSIMDEFK